MGSKDEANLVKNPYIAIALIGSKIANMVALVIARGVRHASSKSFGVIIDTLLLSVVVVGVAVVADQSEYVNKNRNRY